MELCRTRLSPTCAFYYILTLFLVFQLILHNASCLVQPTHIDFSPTELVTMIHRTGINRIIQFTSILRQHLEYARRNSPELLNMMCNMRQVTYAGMPLGTELETWAGKMGIPLTVRLFVCLDDEIQVNSYI